MQKECMQRECKQKARKKKKECRKNACRRKARRESASRKQNPKTLTRLGACGPGADLSAFGNARSGPRKKMIKILKNVEISLKILKKTVKNES